MAAARKAGLPGISSFAKGLEQDLDAVTNGLTMSGSSGPVEGRVNHIKMIKRQMFGRAGLPAAPQASPAHRSAMNAARTFTKLGPDPTTHERSHVMSVPRVLPGLSRLLHVLRFGRPPFGLPFEVSWLLA